MEVYRPPEQPDHEKAYYMLATSLTTGLGYMLGECPQIINNAHNFHHLLIGIEMDEGYEPLIVFGDSVFCDN